MSKVIQTSKEYVNGKWQKVNFSEDKKGNVSVKPIRKAIAKKMPRFDAYKFDNSKEGIAWWKKTAKKMGAKAAFEKWSKESKYDPSHKRDSNSPAGIYQAKGSHFAKAGKTYKISKGGWWKE